MSEEHLYTYAENCFSGMLNNGDFFGGSVTLLKNGANTSFAVGAYHDTENGLRKGAVWILNLGEISYTLLEVIDPSLCQVNDGAISISDLVPSSNFTISYRSNGTPTTLDLLSDINGELQITGLESGIYEDITLTETLTGCTDNLGQAILNGTSLDAHVSSTDPISCETANGSISLSNLPPNVHYTISYQFDSSPETIDLSSNTNGEVIVDGLSSGVYSDVRITETLTGCTDNVGQTVLSGTSLDVQITATDPTTCNSMDGSITIQDLLPNAEYTVSYSHNSRVENLNEIANANGKIKIHGLDSGIYSDIIISKNLSSCSIAMEILELSCSNDSLECFKVKKFFTPNSDGVNDLWNLEVLNDCDYTVYIYDRYGKLLSILNQNRPNWDGQFNGHKMPSSDYWYRVDYIMGSNKMTFKSHFSLKR